MASWFSTKTSLLSEGTVPFLCPSQVFCLLQTFLGSVIPGRMSSLALAMTVGAGMRQCLCSSLLLFLSEQRMVLLHHHKMRCLAARCASKVKEVCFLVHFLGVIFNQERVGRFHQALNHVYLLLIYYFS